MRSTVSIQDQIVLPAALRRQDEVEPGGEFEVERLGPGDSRLIRRSPPRNQGLVDRLMR
jgi:bifunctional DNA-binding transcriptional regulator/antitoxin component of YhaV-PrlF toxin-antitoxin module